MLNLKLATWLVGLSFLCYNTLALETEIFLIKPETDIPATTFGSEEHYNFPTTLKYTVTSSQERFTSRLRKSDVEIQPIRTSHNVHSKISLVHHENFSPRQVAIYTDVELKTVVALNCDAKDHTCHLTGSISHGDKRWRISPLEGEPNKYRATRGDDVTYDVKDAMREGQQWQIDGEPPLEIRKPHKTTQTERERPRFERAGYEHYRYRRAIISTCNIFEAYAVADATVWDYFLARNGNNGTLARADIRQHYEALFREVDVILSCLPDELCLRVLLVGVLIQTNETTDWTDLTGGGNVDGIPSLDRCDELLPDGHGGPEGAFCFTR